MQRAVTAAHHADMVPGGQCVQVQTIAVALRRSVLHDSRTTGKNESKVKGKAAYKGKGKGGF